MRSRYLCIFAVVVFAILVSNAQIPRMTSISPTTGPVGTQVQINGSGFGTSQGSSSVSFNGATATIVSWSNGQITATVPSAATNGPVTVVEGGLPSNANLSFTVPPPSVTSISPTSGVPGTQVTINGVGFQATQPAFGSVYFNGLVAAISSWSDTKIVATVPASVTTGPASVMVNGASSNQNIVFTAVNPVVTALTPSSGPVGTQVQINGVAFGATQGSSAVTFNGKTATINSWSSTQIVATVPSTATTGQLSVTVGGVASNTGIYFNVPHPQVTSISPTGGVPGTQITINGSGFQAAQGSSTIWFNNSVPTVNSWSDTQIRATIASGTTSGPVLVTVNSVASNQDVVLAMPNPVVNGLSPLSGPGGTQVQINGTGFGATQGSSTVTIGGYPPASVLNWSNTQIVATVVNYANTGSVTVTVGGVTSNSDNVFTVPAAQVTSISPTSGVVGTQVTITGTNFQSAKPTYGSLSFNNVTASNIISWTNTQIVATVPSGARSGPVTVTPNSMVSTLTSNENVVFAMPSPVVASFSPTSGPGGTPVQISGTGFGATQGSSTIAFNGVNAAVSNWSDTQISATVPSSATTGSVKVTEGGVSSNTNISFTVPAPQITSISPTSGLIGTQVTINGANFQATRPTSSSVAFNGSSATIVTWNNSQIVAAVPANATTGSVSVVVNGVNSNQDVQFTLPTLL